MAENIFELEQRHREVVDRVYANFLLVVNTNEISEAEFRFLAVRCAKRLLDGVELSLKPEILKPLVERARAGKLRVVVLQEAVGAVREAIRNGAIMREATAEELARVEHLCAENPNCHLIRSGAMGDCNTVRVEMDGGGAVVFVHPLDFLEFVDSSTADEGCQ